MGARLKTTARQRTTMPWMALVSDISGVCNVLGTFEVTANPTNRTAPGSPGSPTIRCTSRESFRSTTGQSPASSSKSEGQPAVFDQQVESGAVLAVELALACSGIVAGRFSGAAMVTSCDDCRPDSVEFRCRPSAGEIHHHAGFIASAPAAVTSDGARAARRQRGGDHHVEKPQSLLNAFAAGRSSSVGSRA